MSGLGLVGLRPIPATAQLLQGLTERVPGLLGIAVGEVTDRGLPTFTESGDLRLRVPAFLQLGDE